MDLSNIRSKLSKYKFPLLFVQYLLNKKKYKKICSKVNLMFCTDIETVNKILSEKKSLARFGDGEFLGILNKNVGSFQDNSIQMSKKLEKVLNNKNENLLIGIPNIFNYEEIKSYNLKPKMFWINCAINYYNSFNQLFIRKEYSNSIISRFYIDYKDKNYSKERIANLKRIWEKKEIVIVEGERTKLGVGNDLFDNAKDIKRIVCPAKNAFFIYDKIFDTIVKYGKNKLILIALGPTATILASDLCDLNKGKIEYQAIDIGHIDIEYEWFLRKAKEKVSIEGKYVNESKKEDLSNIKFNEKDERDYNNSIICKILE